MSENLSGFLNLLKLKGAAVVSANVNGRQQNCVLIPVAINDIDVKANDQGAPSSATLPLRAWVTRKSFQDSYLSRHQNKDNATPPSHQLSVGYSQDFREKAKASALKRLLAENQEKGIDESQEKTEEKANHAILNAAQCGFLFTMQPKSQAQYTGSAPTVDAQNISNVSEQEAEYDDLPF